MAGPFYKSDVYFPTMNQGFDRPQLICLTDIPSGELTANAPENWCLEDAPASFRGPARRESFKVSKFILSIHG